MPTKFISVRNPANGNIGTMPETAFENTFKEKGFTKVSDEPKHMASGRDPAAMAMSAGADAEPVDEESEDEPEEDTTSRGRGSRTTS